MRLQDIALCHPECRGKSPRLGGLLVVERPRYALPSPKKHFATPKTTARLAHHLAIGGLAPLNGKAGRCRGIFGPLKAVVRLDKASRQQVRYSMSP